MTSLPRRSSTATSRICCSSCLTSIIASCSVLTGTVACLPGCSCIMASRISSLSLRCCIIRRSGSSRS
jgi:hypothetical protein